VGTQDNHNILGCGFLKNFWEMLVCFALVPLVSLAAKAETLAGSEWGLIGHPERFIQFKTGGRVSGFAGCNRFFATSEIQMNRLRLGPLGTTRKLCSKEVMPAERAFLSILERTRSFERKAGVLVFKNGNGMKLLSLQHRDWD